MRRLEEVLRDWEAVIGLEIHTELTALKTKMFCNCRLSHDDPPNTNVCPVCLGMPGALPVPNEQAIEAIVMAGLATNCEIQRRSMFYRKHYFYPDMAKNFQTTQGPVAFCMHGCLDLEVTGEGARERPAWAAHAGDGVTPVERGEDGSYRLPVRILRIHMEEDAAKMVHMGGEEGRITAATESLIDYNRCGTPLIELVTEPDLRTPEEARLFMEKLRQIFLTLGISDCSLESGSMRCDGNVSLRRRGKTGLGVKTEMKNLNSFKALHDALAFEICRQAEVLDQGGSVRQETRHWEPSRRRTVVMRVKETADDYRFFPDPDLAPFDLSDAFVERCRARIPELPDERRDRYVGAWGVRRRDAAQLAGDPAAVAFLEEVVAVVGEGHAAQVAKVLCNELSGWLRGRGLPMGAAVISPQQAGGLALLLESDQIPSSRAGEVLDLLAQGDKTADEVVDEAGLRQAQDASELEPVVDAVLARCEGQVAQYRAGATKVLGYLVGQCMKESHGSGNPKLFNQILRKRLSD